MSFTDNYEDLERLLLMQVENKGKDHEEVTKMFIKMEKKRRVRTCKVDQKSAGKNRKTRSSKVDK